MPPHLYPRTMHFDKGTEPAKVISKLEENNFSYPLIGKPDTGGRGRGVKQLVDRKQVEDYARTTPVDFHIQEFISYKNEAGIFYYRYPGKDKGRISGIVRKEFLTVTGDGVATLRQLIMKEERSLLQMQSLENIYGGYLDTVLAAGEEKLLVPYGNHARGARFLDDSRLADKKLEVMINDICTRIDGFYFGRLDIKYNTWEELKEGKNFSVIEVNGAGSEPTHIYDPGHSIFFAWKEIIRHWFILNKISIMNHRKGHKYLTVKEGLAMFREDKMHSEKLKVMPE